MQVHPTLDQIRALPAAERLAVIAELAERVEEARPLRDAAIRELRAAGGHTVDQLAAAAHVSTATVKIVLRQA